MIHPQLTIGADVAKTCMMQEPSNHQWPMGLRLTRFRGMAGAVLLGSLIVLSACVSVSAPDKPIVIELNINIKHELVVQLSQAAEKTMNEHKDIF